MNLSTQHLDEQETVKLSQLNRQKAAEWLSDFLRVTSAACMNIFAICPIGNGEEHWLYRCHPTLPLQGSLWGLIKKLWLRRKFMTASREASSQFKSVGYKGKWVDHSTKVCAYLQAGLRKYVAVGRVLAEDRRSVGLVSDSVTVQSLVILPCLGFSIWTMYFLTGQIH